MGKDILVILLVYWFISMLEIDNIWLIEVIVEDVKGNFLNCEQSMVVVQVFMLSQKDFLVLLSIQMLSVDFYLIVILIFIVYDVVGNFVIGLVFLMCYEGVQDIIFFDWKDNGDGSYIQILIIGVMFGMLMFMLQLNGVDVVKVFVVVNIIFVLLF